MAVVADRGTEAASLRSVAAAAGVSPALVNHHFGTRRGLLDEIDAEAVGVFARAYAGKTHASGPSELLRQRAAQTEAVMREHPEVCAFIGRRLAEPGPGSVEFLRRFVMAGRQEVESLQAAGAIRPDADALWVTLQHFLLIWAPLTFRASFEELLGARLIDRSILERWSGANVMLLREGLYREQ